MEDNTLEGTGGWLLVYLIGSIPLLIVYSMGLSGWFFEYPIALMIAIFLILAVPLLLILSKSRKAPQWNIALLWAAAVLMTLRSLSVILMPSGTWDPMMQDELFGVVTILLGIVGFSVLWAIVWTLYFKKSQRVRNTFGE
ncbi:MAG: DUF2569 family protein [Rhodothermales bacterium]|nr:DUF2569 family protein [Rhodothermales bacterium]